MLLSSHLSYVADLRPLQFFTTLNDLWGKTEEIWEGVFSLIAWCVSRFTADSSIRSTDNLVVSIIIFVMGVTM